MPWNRSLGKLMGKSDQELWVRKTFAPAHSSIERLFWPEVATFESWDPSLRLGDLGQPPECREAVGPSQHCNISKLMLDFAAIQKLAYLAEQVYDIEFISERFCPINRIGGGFIFHERRDLCNDILAANTRRQIDLFAVKQLEILSCNDLCAWSTRSFGTIEILPLSNVHVQKQLACLLKCMPNLKKVKVNRVAADEFLECVRYCITTTEEGKISRLTHGAAVISELEKTDKEIQRWMNDRLISTEVRTTHGLNGLCERILIR